MVTIWEKYDGTTNACVPRPLSDTNWTKQIESRRAFGVKFTVRLIRHTVGRSRMQNTKCWRGSIFENLLVIHVSYHCRKNTCFISSSWKNGSRISSWNISCVCSFQTFPSLRWKWNLILLHLHPLPEIRKYTFLGTQVFNSLAHMYVWWWYATQKKKTSLARMRRGWTFLPWVNCS